MMDWIRRVLDWIRRFLIGRPDAVRRAQQELERAQAHERDAQQNRERVRAKLKAVKGQPNPNPAEVQHLEGDVDEFQRLMDQAHRRVKQMQAWLNELDPDGSIRASLP